MMLCKGCRYRLDHLDRDRCPECGRPFDPSRPETFLSGTPITLGGRMRRAAWVVPSILVLMVLATWAGIVLGGMTYQLTGPYHGREIMPPAVGFSICILIAAGIAVAMYRRMVGFLEILAALFAFELLVAGMVGMVLGFPVSSYLSDSYHLESLHHWFVVIQKGYFVGGVIVGSLAGYGMRLLTKARPQKSDHA